MPISPDQVWQQALGELQFQLTGATFDTWLGRTKLIGFEHDEFTIGVHNTYAQDWLSNRLDGMIRRVLSRVVGKAVAVKFVVYNGNTPDVAFAVGEPAEVGQGGAIETSEVAAPAMPEMPDLKDVGYFPVSRYECTFWAPLLGRVPWRVWEIVRGADIRREKTDWTPERRWSAPEMARMVPCGPQAVVGVNRQDGHQAGALERMLEMGIGQYRRQGNDRDPHTMYSISVRVRLPLIPPVSVMHLTDSLRHRHDQWLEEHGFDPRDWFVDGG
jgi:hypothetical protein